jgi:hypothetical protein
VDNADLEDMLSKRNRAMEKEGADGVDKADKEKVDKADKEDVMEVQTGKRNSQDRTCSTNYNMIYYFL